MDRRKFMLGVLLILPGAALAHGSQGHCGARGGPGHPLPHGRCGATFPPGHTSKGGQHQPKGGATQKGTHDPGADD